MPHDAVEQDLGAYHAWWGHPHEIYPGGTAFMPIQVSLEESKVYAYWLRYLSKGPNWDSIPFDGQNQIKVRLREEVQAVAAKTQQIRKRVEEGKLFSGFGESEKYWGDVMQVYPSPGYSIGPDPGPVPDTESTNPNEQPRPPFFAWKPKDLLKEVGYDD